MQQKINDRGTWLDAVEIRALNASEIEEALDVLSRGMRDNPLTVAAFGEDPERRRQRFRRFVGGAAKALDWRPNMPPEVWERLAALKNRYDPENLFRFNRNIPPSSAAASAA